MPWGVGFLLVFIGQGGGGFELFFARGGGGEFAHYFVSTHFLQQISIFQSSFWFVNTLFYKNGF